MNILLVNHYAGSPEIGMEFRPWYMAREWIKLGHNVLIVTASFAHVRNVQFEVEKKYQEKNIGGINYLIIKTPEYKGNSFDRVINMFTFVRGLYKYKKHIAEYFSPDIVIASSTYPLDIFPCRKIAQKCKAKLVYEVHDLWPLSPIELGGYSKWHPFILIMQKAENYAYKHSDKVISMLPNTKEHMRQHGLNLNKWYYIPNGVVIDEWEKKSDLPETHNKLLKSEKSKGNILIGYAGSHGIANALHTIINAMEKLKKYKISLFLVGNGPFKQNLISLCKQLDLNNVFFLEPVKKQLIPSFLDKMDILYIGLQNQPLFRFGISPNKLIDYLMAGKPIIQAIKAGNDIVKEAECGISIEPENPEKISEAIIKLINITEEERQKLGNNGNRYCLKNHDYKVLAKKFIDILDDKQ